MENAKEKFLEIYNNNITREGSKELLEFLQKSDFFVAPASTQFHNAYEGGLCEHSINVYNRFLNAVKNEFGENYLEKVSNETIAICGLLHDICKVETFKVDTRNKKVDGNWVQVPYYTVDDSLPYGHGEKSVYIISGFMRLSREEAMIINWHMGGFDARVRGGAYGLSDAYYKYPLAPLFHTCDMLATYLDEVRYSNN
ncbi:MAG: hydrolase [Firmicutes bacterium]|nr:hydrolase [Bacillota bacterium]MDY5676329.1 hydrolase [Eubacteriales bacterium]